MSGNALWLGRYNKLQEQYNEAFTSIQDQKQLIAQLEEDLRSVNAWSAMFRGTAEVRLTMTMTVAVITYFSQWFSVNENENRNFR